MLSGSAEGVYGWFAVNHATGALQLVGPTIPFLVAEAFHSAWAAVLHPHLQVLKCCAVHSSGHA